MGISPTIKQKATRQIHLASLQKHTEKCSGRATPEIAPAAAATAANTSIPNEKKNAYVVFSRNKVHEGRIRLFL